MTYAFRRCRGCLRSIDRMRSDARWCSDACRKRAQRPDSTDKARNRRLSRDGKGTRIYFTAPELIELWGGQVPGEVAQKVWRALERVSA